MADFAGLRLADIASAAGAETSRRMTGQDQMQRAGLDSALRLILGGLKGDEEAGARQQNFESRQQALDHANARREQAMRSAAAMASARLAQQQRAKDRAYAEEQERRENASWFMKQAFQTDENIRQAEAMAALEARLGGAQVDDSLPRLSDFGRHEINPMRGQALDLAGTRFPYHEGDMEATRALIESNQGDTDRLLQALREHYGQRDRTASQALWDLGWRGYATG